jgi:hypothetical protein
MPVLCEQCNGKSCKLRDFISGKNLSLPDLLSAWRKLNEDCPENLEIRPEYEKAISDKIDQLQS